MSDKYILQGHTPVRVHDLLEWARRQGDGPDSRRVARTEIGDVDISTVFLGLDHRFVPGGPPLLFETMIFGGEHDGWQDRYSTWEEAEAGHAAAVAMVKPPEPDAVRNT